MSVEKTLCDLAFESNNALSAAITQHLLARKRLATSLVESGRAARALAAASMDTGSDLIKRAHELEVEAQKALNPQKEDT